MQDASDEALVQRAVDGDEVALTLLLTQSRARLCLRVGERISAPFRRVITPDDVVQEAHAEIFRRIGAFESQGPGSFDRWVTTIAIRRLRSAIKMHRAAKRGGGNAVVEANRKFEDSTIALLDRVAGPGRTPSRVVSRREALGAMNAAMSRIPEHYREAIQLVHIQGRSVKEAGEKMGRTERAVHGLLRRGLEQLNHELGTASDFLSFGG